MVGGYVGDKVVNFEGEGVGARVGERVGSAVGEVGETVGEEDSEARREISASYLSSFPVFGIVARSTIWGVVNVCVCINMRIHLDLIEFVFCCGRKVYRRSGNNKAQEDFGTSGFV